MQTPFPEDEVAFDGLGELMGLGSPVAGGPECDSCLIPRNAMPSESEHVFQTYWLKIRRERVGGPYLVCDRRTPRDGAEELLNSRNLWYMTLAMAGPDGQWRCSK